MSWELFRELEGDFASRKWFGGHYKEAYGADRDQLAANEAATDAAHDAVTPAPEVPAVAAAEGASAEPVATEAPAAAPAEPVAETPAEAPVAPVEATPAPAEGDA